MGRYAIPGNVAAVTTSFQSAAVAFATPGSPKRGFVMELDFSVPGAPNGTTDCQIQWELIRQTAPGTATAFIPNDLSGGADGACNTTGGIAASAEGTVTASSQVFQKAHNQRSSSRWQAYDRSAALIWPAANNAGFALRGKNPTSTSYAGQILGTMTFEE